MPQEDTLLRPVTFLEYKHAVEGALTFAATPSVVVLRCEWPFDRSTDEWIRLSNDFDRDTFVRAVERLVVSGSAALFGRRGGQLLLNLLPNKQVEIDFSDPSPVAPTRLQLLLNIDPTALYPTS